MNLPLTFKSVNYSTTTILSDSAFIKHGMMLVGQTGYVVCVNSAWDKDKTQDYYPYLEIFGGHLRFP